jgi:hypothetical protein
LNPILLNTPCCLISLLPMLPTLTHYTTPNASSMA